MGVGVWVWGCGGGGVGCVGVGVWGCGGVGVGVGVWVRGCVGVWVCGSVGVWVCVCVGVWVWVWGWGWVGRCVRSVRFAACCFQRMAAWKQSWRNRGCVVTRDEPNIGAKGHNFYTRLQEDRFCFFHLIFPLFSTLVLALSPYHGRTSPSGLRSISPAKSALNPQPGSPHASASPKVLGEGRSQGEKDQSQENGQLGKSSAAKAIEGDPLRTGKIMSGEPPLTAQLSQDQ